MIRVQDLKAGYRTGFRRTWKEVIKGISFEVCRGSVTGYLGVNGAGKTTTIKVLVGVNPATSGTVEVAGSPVGAREAHDQLGYFPEAPFFYEGLTGQELLEFYGRLSGMSREDRARRGAELMDDVGLGESRALLVKEYSKGMRQRLGLAQALIHDPELLVLDEPLDGLDPMGRLHLRGLITDQASRGKTVFFSSHVLSDVEAISSNLIILDGGKIAYDGPTAGVSGAPERTVVQFAGTEATADAVRAAAGEVEVERRGDGSWELSCGSEAVVDAVVDAVRENEGRLVLIQPQRPTLEQAFLARFSKADGAPEQEAPAVQEQST